MTGPKLSASMRASTPQLLPRSFHGPGDVRVDAPGSCSDRPRRRGCRAGILTCVLQVMSCRLLLIDFPVQGEVMSAPKPSSLKLSRQPEAVVWPETHYVFLEKIGPFQDTAALAWKEFRQLLPQLAARHRITGFLSLYKVGPKIYRAGVALAAEPGEL